MIADEIKTDSSIVRIHDEFCNIPTQGCISHLNQIVTNSYKRRIAVVDTSQGQEENPLPQ